MFVKPWIVSDEMPECPYCDDRGIIRGRVGMPVPCWNCGDTRLWRRVGFVVIGIFTVVVLIRWLM